MRLTLTVNRADTLAVVSRGTWHVPNDIAAWLGTSDGGPARCWASALGDLRLTTGVAVDLLDGARLEQSWQLDPCHCVACTVPAAADATSRPRPVFKER